MSSKQKFIQGGGDVNLVHENEKPKTGEEYKNRLEDPNLKDEIALTMSGDKKGLKKRFKKGEYQRGLVDNLKYGSDKSKDFTIDDFVRLAEVQQWTLKEYAIWLKEYIEKNKYISPDNLPALFELVDKYRTKYRSNELDDLFDDNISQILGKMFKFLDKNKGYEPNQEAMLRFKKIIMNANQEDATIHLRQGEKHLSYNLFLKCVGHIKDIDKRKEVLSNMKDFFKNAIGEHIFFAWGIDVPTDCSRYPNGGRDYPPTEYIKIESGNQEIKGNLYIYVGGVGYMDTVNGNILEVEIDGKMEPITYFNGRQGIIKVGDKELINAETKKHSFVFDTDTMQSYRDIKINGKELAYISPSYSLGNKSVLYVYPRRGPSFVIDAETFEPLKIKGTEKYIHSIDDRTLFLNKKCAIANGPQNLRPRSSVLIDEETLEPIKITGTDDIITCVETISDSEEKIGTRLLYRVKTKKQKKWKEWIVVDGETGEPLKISGTDDVITYVRQLNDNQKIGGRLLYFVKTNKWEQGIIVNGETLEPLKIKGIENIIKSVYTKEKYSLGGKECYLVKDGKNNNLIIDISTLEPVVVDDGGNIEKNRKLFINSVLSENKLDQKDVLSIRANNDKSNYKMLIDPKNIQKLDVNIVGTDEHLVKLSSNSFELGGKKYFNGSTDKNRNVIIAVDTKFDGKTMEEAKIQISGTQDFISGFIPPKFHNVWGKEVIEVEVNSVEVNSKKRIYIDVQTLEPIKMKTHNGEKILDVSGYENILGLEVLRVTVAKGRTGYSCRYLNPNTMEPLRIKSQVGENLRTNKYGYTGTPFDINKIRRGGTIITGFKEPPHFRSLDPKWHIAVTVDGENYITVQKDDLVY